MILSNKTYNFLKWLITIFLPAVGALYFAIAQIWDFQRITGVNGTINAIIAFLGVLIGVSTRQYNKTDGAPDGDLLVTQDAGEVHLSLGVNHDSVAKMVAKESVKLNVVDTSTPMPPQ